MTAELDRERMSIAQDLESADEEMRRLAVERLLALPSGEAIPFLVERLGDSSWRVRKAAVERLVHCPETDRVVAALIVSLSDGDNPGRRNSAVEALVLDGTASIPALIDTLASADIDVRKLAVDALAGIGDATAREALLEVLRDPDSNVRAAAADALGAIGGSGASSRLFKLALAAEEDSLVRLSALRALHRLEAEVPAADLQAVASDPVLRPAAYTLLGYGQPQGALEMLEKGVVSNARGAREAAMAAVLQQLSRMDGAEADALAERMRAAYGDSTELLEPSFERLQEADLPTRLMLVQFLGLMALPSCVLPILEAARDEALLEVVRATMHGMGACAEEALDQAWESLDSDLRSVACDVLGMGASGRGASRLREALQEADPMLRISAARALGSRCCGEALGELLGRLERLEEDEADWQDEQDALVASLARLGHPAPQGAGLAEQAVELMASRLDTASPSARLSVAMLMAQIGDASREADTRLVSQLLRDPDPQVRRAAVQTIAVLDPERARELLRLSLGDESSVVRGAAAAALGLSNEPGVVEDLQALLLDEDARARAAAVRAIGEHCARADGPRVAEGIALIASALQDHCLVALAGVEALEKLGGDEASSAACAALERPEIELVQAAAQCVGRHASVENLRELLRLVPHESWMVRAEVIQILGERRFVQAMPSILRGLENERHEFVRETILVALKRLEE